MYSCDQNIWKYNDDIPRFRFKDNQGFYIVIEADSKEIAEDKFKELKKDALEGLDS